VTGSGRRVLSANGRRTASASKTRPLAVKEACEKFVADAEARNLREPPSINTACSFVVARFCPMHGLLCITELRHDWVRPVPCLLEEQEHFGTQKLEAFRAFFRLSMRVVDSDESSESSKAAKDYEPPTAPFTREEVASILKACDIYPDKATRFVCAR